MSATQDEQKDEVDQNEQNEVPPTFSMLEFSNYIEKKHAFID